MQINILELYIAFLTTVCFETENEIVMDAVYTWVNGSDPMWLD